MKQTFIKITEKVSSKCYYNLKISFWEKGEVKYFPDSIPFFSHSYGADVWCAS